MHLYVPRNEEALTLWQKLKMPFLPFSFNLWAFVFATLFFITSAARLCGHDYIGRCYIGHDFIRHV